MFALCRFGVSFTQINSVKRSPVSTTTTLREWATESLSSCASCKCLTAPSTAPNSFSGLAGGGDPNTHNNPNPIVTPRGRGGGRGFEAGERRPGGRGRRLHRERSRERDRERGGSNANGERGGAAREHEQARVRESREAANEGKSEARAPDWAVPNSRATDVESGVGGAGTHDDRGAGSAGGGGGGAGGAKNGAGVGRAGQGQHQPHMTSEEPLSSINEDNDGASSLVLTLCLLCAYLNLLCTCFVLN